MKSNFKTSREGEGIAQMIGKETEDLENIIDTFSKKVENNELETYSDIVRWCTEIAKTPEEAIIYTLICTRKVQDSETRRKLETENDLMNLFRNLQG